MIIGFLKDNKLDIAPIVPGNVPKLLDLFDQVLVESSIGQGSFFGDEDFAEAKVCSRNEILISSDVVVQINPDISKADFSKMKDSAIALAQFAPFNDKSIADKLKSQGVHAFSLDMIPRTTLAQSMDVLSSMASIAGYQAVLVALRYLPRFMPMMITAAGSIKPSRVLVIGAGVAGLQAIATARRLGAIVEAFDTRTAVREEVESLGAKFVEVEGAIDDVAAGGYAVEQTEDYKKRQAAKVQERAEQADIIITTAQLRGKPAPKIVSRETVTKMKPGSVIVDLAASTGGNCEGTVNDEVVELDGVFIVGDSNLANQMAQDASTLYSNNVLNFLKHIVREGKIDLDSEDEILSNSLITKQA